jgi:dipeptidyl aminopeptidase/acylaminoacyl peptidase
MLRVATSEVSRKPSHGRGRWAALVVRLVAAAAILLAAVYGAAAVRVYDEVSQSAAGSGADGLAPFESVTPVHLTFEVGAVRHDFTRYEMAGFRDVRFPSRDGGIEVAAWYVAAANPGARLEMRAVILVHGLRSSRHDPSVLVPAGMLNAHGYSVLVMDLRDHGDSTWEDGRYAGGIEERADVLGAVDWLIDQGVPSGRVGLFGTSMGAGAALITAAVEPGIPAVWEDSSYADTETRIAEELASRGYPTLLAPAAPIVARIVAGDDLAAWSPLRAVGAYRDTALYVTHGGDDRVTYVAHAHALYGTALAAGVDVDLWVAPGMGHVEAYLHMTEEYERRLVGFFDGHIGGR